MELSGDDKRRVEERVRGMIAEYRAKPTQEKEDHLGVELLAMPPAEREYTTVVLLRIVTEERGAGRPPA